MASYDILTTPPASSSSSDAFTFAPHSSISAPPDTPSVPELTYLTICGYFLLSMITLFLMMTSLMIAAVGPLVTADAMYTPTFDNATASPSYNLTTTVTGTGRIPSATRQCTRSRFLVLDDSLDGVVVSESNSTYHGGYQLDNGAFPCTYVYNMGYDGNKTDYTVPSCASATFIRVCLTMYGPLMFAVFCMFVILGMNLHPSFMQEQERNSILQQYDVVNSS